ncbi:glycosyltransferase [Clostridium sp. AL.422]|uniref:glycosyltransferase family 2 protein n=1 Tax=Clostridium TaxID=1485 RepID=UPI00293DEAA3|nr:MULTISPECIES: glycosyltransferase [unclassified Clostridium]MDV4151961.1 glycosyltransferase [Clostridium sp. AL.422]
MMKVLIASPINQRPEILVEFLKSLKELNKDNIEYNYFFIDDNKIKESTKILNEFNNYESNVSILRNELKSDQYICDDITHRWTNDLVKKVAEFKNFMLTKAINEDFDYLFLVDSDLVLHENTLKRLISLNKEIVSTVFWTRWHPNYEEEPQVWLKDNYTLYDTSYNESISSDEAERRKKEFINTLRKPGTYKVGGLGACTLISKEAIRKGVNFNEIYNISFGGEDRHFCIRAAVLGIQLYVDTYYPAYHIYRFEDLSGIEKYKNDNKNRDFYIYSEKAYDLLKKAIEGIGEYNYRDKLHLEYLEYFGEGEKEKIIKKFEENKDYVIMERVRNSTKITNHKIVNITDDIKEVTIRVIYTTSGYKNDYSYYKEFEGEFILKLQDNDDYIINECKFIKERRPAISPLIRKAKENNNKLTLSMIVKNEENRFLKEVLKSAREYIDNAVIIDDASTDNTIGIIEDIFKDIPYKLIRNEVSKFENEVDLRKQQWNETIKTNPDWILFLDADEIFEDNFKDYIKILMENTETDGYLFRLYDFWNNEEYREDNLWNAHSTYRLFLIRYQENFKYKFKESAQHCGRIPYNCINLSYLATNLRLKHYGWSREEDRLEKYNRYMKLDPEGKFGNLEQYKSILDKKPHLVKWE